jgi:hypothetical protein
MAATPFFNVTEPVDGIIYYIIPAGTRLFRGDVPPNSNSPLEHITWSSIFWSNRRRCTYVWNTV